MLIIDEIGKNISGTGMDTNVVGRKFQVHRAAREEFSQSHDHKNLFVVDGAQFTSAGWQNPTMTILSLSMRASEYLAGEMLRQNI